MIKGRVRVKLNDGPDLKFRVDPNEFVMFASQFKLEKVSSDGLVANYVYFVPGSDWRASLFEVFTSDIVYLSTNGRLPEPSTYQSEGGLNYVQFVQSQLPTRLNDRLMKALSADYDVTFELYV